MHLNSRIDHYSRHNDPESAGGQKYKVKKHDNLIARLCDYLQCSKEDVVEYITIPEMED